MLQSDRAVPLLRLSDVGKSYALGRSALARLLRREHFHAVAGLSFDLAAGESLAIVGESGSGKSTVARMMVRLIEPTGGDIEFKGRSIAQLAGDDLAAFRKQVQMVFQSTMNSLNPRKTVATALAEAIGRDGVPISDLLDMVRLPRTVLARLPHQLSGGQRQRVGIARALARRPTLLVADEPTSALDVSIQAEIIRLLRELHRTAGVTLVVISHDLALVGELCERVAVMQTGRLVEIGNASQVLHAPRERYTAELLAAIPRGLAGQHAAS